MRRLFNTFRADRSGATAIEYAFILFFVALGIAATVRTIPPSLNDIFVRATPPPN